LGASERIREVPAGLGFPDAGQLLGDGMVI
jgi:hypothetical protein